VAHAQHGVFVVATRDQRSRRAILLRAVWSQSQFPRGVPHQARHPSNEQIHHGARSRRAVDHARDHAQIGGRTCFPNLLKNCRTMLRPIGMRRNEILAQPIARLRWRVQYRCLVPIQWLHSPTDFLLHTGAISIQIHGPRLMRSMASTGNNRVNLGSSQVSARREPNRFSLMGN
jgi:hypothetical protein